MIVILEFSQDSRIREIQSNSSRRSFNGKTLNKMIVISLFLLIFSSVESAKILLVFSVPSKSHYILGNALARGLAERGHDVTMISPYVEKNPPKNGTYRDVVLIGLINDTEKKQSGQNLFNWATSNAFITATVTTVMMSELNVRFFEHPNVQKLLKSNEKFDAVIVEQFSNDGLKVLAPYFDAPLILFSTVTANNWMNPLVGNPSPTSYVPELLLSYSSQMTFTQRLTNLLFTLYTQSLYHLYLYPSENRRVKKYLTEDIDFYEVLYNSSICLLNSHPSISQPVPHVPNMIDIGGFHVKPPKKLPEDLQKFLDNAKDGVIYFSMGSNLQGADLPAEKRDIILKIFSKLKQKIIWKFEDDNLPGKPDNLKIGKWFPQQDILAHKNVKLFITHGGLLSLIETVYHGVPILAIPIFGDQKMNAKVSVDIGIGLMLAYEDLNEKNFEEKLQEILNNHKYTEAVKNRARIYHDRENKPLDTALFWIEHVIRHRGATHLRVAGLDLPWYKYFLLDIIGFLAVLFGLVAYIGVVIFKRICSKFCKRQNVDNKAKLKTN